MSEPIEKIDQLKPCPFCGREAIATERNGGWTIDCKYSDPFAALDDDTNQCLGMVETWLHPSREAAAKQWNTRPIEDALRAQLAQAEAERDALKDALRFMQGERDGSWDQNIALRAELATTKSLYASDMARLGELNTFLHRPNVNSVAGEYVTDVAMRHISQLDADVTRLTTENARLTKELDWYHAIQNVNDLRETLNGQTE